MHISYLDRWSLRKSPIPTEPNNNIDRIGSGNAILLRSTCDSKYAFPLTALCGKLKRIQIGDIP